MTSRTITQAERNKAAALVSQYRAIGPAAVLAALLCKPQPKPADVEDAQQVQAA